MNWTKILVAGLGGWLIGDFATHFGVGLLLAFGWGLLVALLWPDDLDLFK